MAFQELFQANGYNLFCNQITQANPIIPIVPITGGVAWIPVITNLTGNTGTPDNVTGDYIQVGNIVFASVYFEYSQSGADYVNFSCTVPVPVTSPFQVTTPPFHTTIGTANIFFDVSGAPNGGTAAGTIIVSGATPNISFAPGSTTETNTAVGTFMYRIA